MPKKYHEKLADNIRAQQVEDEKPEVKTAEELSDSTVQQRIMDPNGTPVDLSYGKIVVYPYTIRNKRRAGGFLAQVFADAVGAGSRSEEEFKLRVASLLTRREDLELELFRLCAVACGKPGSDEKKTLPIVAELQEKCTSSDVVQIFSVISELAEFSAPKL